MRPMFNVIALELVSRVTWGLKLRVFLSGFISALDLATDIFITYTFWKDGKEIFYKLSLSMLLASFFLSLSIVCAQHRKMGWKALVLESIPIFVGLKPAVDAYRVASGAEIKEGQIFHPLMEMQYMRGIEMFAEAIPGVIIQLSAILTHDRGDASFAALLSLSVSALTTGIVSASFCYDIDTDPGHRNDDPEFYGFVPDNARLRGGTYICMILLSSCLLVLRAMILCLIGMVSSISCTCLVIAADMGVYLLIKIFRRDFYHW